MEQTPYKRYFYHSFPQWVGTGPNNLKGSPVGSVRILYLMFRWGLLLTPEDLTFRGEPYKDQVDGNPIQIRQRRFCLTELAEDELAAHAQVFGPISLEFDQQTLRRMGGLPVVYIPQELSSQPQQDQLALLGQTLVYRLFDTYQLLSDLASVQETVLNVKDDTGFITLGHPERGVTYKYPIYLLRHFFDNLTYKKQPLDQLAAAMSALSCFFYPTDSSAFKDDPAMADGRLLFYREREWRIVSGVRFGGQPLDEEIPRDALHEIAAAINGSTSPYDGGKLSGNRYVANSSLVRTFNTRPIMNSVRRVFVPKELVSEVTALAHAFGFQGLVTEY